MNYHNALLLGLIIDADRVYTLVGIIGGVIGIVMAFFAMRSTLVRVDRGAALKATMEIANAFKLASEAKSAQIIDMEAKHHELQTQSQAMEAELREVISQHTAEIDKLKTDLSRMALAYANVVASAPPIATPQAAPVPVTRRPRAKKPTP